MHWPAKQAPTHLRVVDAPSPPPVNAEAAFAWASATNIQSVPGDTTHPRHVGKAKGNLYQTSNVYHGGGEVFPIHGEFELWSPS